MKRLTTMPSIASQVAAAITVAALVAVIPTSSVAATMDQHLTCSLVYGALFESAKRAQHEGMLQYAKPRLQAVLPYMQENKENPTAKRRLKEIATNLEQEIRYDFVQKVTGAINDGDLGRLKTSMTRVFECDKAFGIASLPLPVQAKIMTPPNKYLVGFQAGCLAKQRGSPKPLSDAKIQKYCACMTEAAAARGVDGATTETQLGSVIRETNGQCVAAIQ